MHWFDFLSKSVPIVGIAVAILFGAALWRHNRRVLYAQDQAYWERHTRSRIQRYVRRMMAEQQRVRLVSDVFRPPPPMRGAPMPYYALCWADVDFSDLDNITCDGVYTTPVYGSDPTSVMLESLLFLGIASTPAEAELLVAQAWLTKHDKAPPGHQPAVRAALLNSPQRREYQLAVLPVKEGFVWVHRIDKKRVTK